MQGQKSSYKEYQKNAPNPQTTQLVNPNLPPQPNNLLLPLPLFKNQISARHGY